jgi:hypothetical protein
MVAVPQLGVVPPAQRRGEVPAVPAVRRRLVAVAVSPMELLRPESDLARLVADGGPVDLLLARDDAPVADEPETDEDQFDELTGFDDDEDGVAAAVAALGFEDLRLHRLGLPGKVGPDAEEDLVAALSELVGFDPEPGVYFVAPLPSPNDPERAAVVAAAQRIVRVYGLPLLRYRCLELSVVGGDQ